MRERRGARLTEKNCGYEREKAETEERERVDIKTTKQKNNRDEPRRKEMKNVEDEKKIRTHELARP